MSDRAGQPAEVSALARYYPAFIAVGIVFFVISLWTVDGWGKLIALVWVVAVPLWAYQYRRYRQSLRP
ncbi:hypothetical protein [Kineococcus terrestris]|uniref:hypothetical protein n=1 Tax=Kineococcus terrestris TaxID=2044856 RepID=UPI0034DAD9D7